MPETPDFDTMAVEALMDQAELLTPDDVVWYDALKRRIMVQLRQVWNARGAADIAASNTVTGEFGYDIPGAIRKLDV